MTKRFQILKLLLILINYLIQYFPLPAFLWLFVCVRVFVWLMFISFFLWLKYRFSDYYFVCAIGGQHDGHLPFWLPGFVKLMLLLHVLFAVAEINILLHINEYDSDINFIALVLQTSQVLWNVIVEQPQPALKFR